MALQPTVHSTSARSIPLPQRFGNGDSGDERSAKASAAASGSENPPSTSKPAQTPDQFVGNQDSSSSSPKSGASKSVSGSSASAVSEAKTQKASATKSVSAVDASGNPASAKTADTSGTSTLVKAVMFANVIPMLSSLLWLGGPIPGILLGAPIAYFSGIYGRRVHKDVNTDKVNDIAVTLDEFARALSNPQKLQPGFIKEGLDKILGTGLMAEAFKSASGWVLNSRIAKTKPFLWLLKQYKQVTKLDELGGAKAATSPAFKLFDRLCKGFAVNLAISKESNPFKAAWAGLVGYLSVVFAWVTLSIDAIKFAYNKVFGNEKNKKDETVKG